MKALAFAIAIVPQLVFATLPRYRVAAEFAGLPSGSYYPISQNGSMVWELEDRSGYITYSPNDGLRSYGNPANSFNPMSIAENGQICGFVFEHPNFPPEGYATIGLAGQFPLTLARTEPHGYDFAAAVNADGLIVGGGAGHGIAWTSPMDFVLLASPTSDYYNGALFVNDSGVIAGQVRAPNSRNIVWDIHDPSQFTLLNAPISGSYSTAISGLNNFGHISGQYIGTTGVRGMIIWNADGTVRTHIPNTGSVGGINDLDQVVGGMFDSGGNPYGTIWSPEDGFTSLNSLLAPGYENYYIGVGTGINNAGQIIASARKNGQYVTVYLQPVPEPASLAALMLGAMEVMRRKRAWQP